MALSVPVGAQDSFPGTLVFAASPAGNWDLFLYRAGEPPRQLTRSSLDERAPALSADNKQVAYATSDGAIRILDLATGSGKQLPLPAGVYGYPAWLPDGSGLVYTSYRYKPPDEDADFVRYDFKEGRQSSLLTQTGPQDFPALSPGGDQFAYMSSLATLVPGFGSQVTQQLWVASLRRGSARQALMGTNVTSRPAWSPDGKWLAFSSDRTGQSEIWVVDVGDDKSLTQVSSERGDKSSPAWSPDGQGLVYVTAAQGIGELTIVNVKSKQIRKLSPFGRQRVSIRDPHWR
jgi:TolB protein